VRFAAGSILLSFFLGVSGCSQGGAESETASGRPELAWGRTAEYDYEPPEPGTYSLPALGPAAGGRVLTAAGEPRELRSLLLGQVTILSFIYTRCRDPRACPMASGVLGTVRSVTEQDPALAANLQLLTFSFDPDHDTPQVMAEYGTLFASREKGGSEWLFLTTAGVEDLEPILNAYGQRVDRKKNPDDPMGPLYHTVRVYLIDGEATIRNIYSFGMLDPRLLLADVRTLLMEETGHKL
jgi:cytochrome oxidase Cu insertion factor (SCO1/SenC/PrrC family)